MKKIILLLLLAGSLSAQVRLPRSTPEKEGVHSESILKFLEEAEKQHIEFHSFMMLRHGKVIAEAWWQPYRDDLVHTLYSLSKSFTATAVGFAVQEGRLSVEDKVVSFFPELKPETVNDNLANLKIRDLLTMSAATTKEPMGIITTDNWVKAYLASEFDIPPGSRFLYNSTATFMCSAIVTKVTGQTVFDYLESRLFKPLSIKGIDWETSPNGINTGGWGLRLHTEDIAKFAQLFLQKGKWNGKQLIDPKWVDTASSKQILQSPEVSDEKRAKSDWLQGYGYQMWRCRNDAFRGDGAFGQYAIVIPDKDVVIVATAETGDMQSEINLFWDNLLPGISDAQNLEFSEKAELLEIKLKSLQLPVNRVQKQADTEKLAHKKEIDFENNTVGLSSLQLDFEKDRLFLHLNKDGQKDVLRIGRAHWDLDHTVIKGPYLVSRAEHNLENIGAFETAGSFTWLDAHRLEITIRYIQSPHTAKYTLHFEGNEVLLDYQSSIPNAETVSIKGKM
ncbi:beta-lactamase family protein [Marinilongibacter aquaticus]|uniref:serine hydrolase domain-containing protein n=1 Tax=Marinilongibacter aquaticus TaxID=2975157 RepID=UPI0021BD3605|nr:serine hydrolase [Marinilongibacter aquaticus]UBM59221.1 beta-lactamase family protein [Marinilongibacter aquaticus]